MEKQGAFKAFELFNSSQVPLYPIEKYERTKKVFFTIIGVIALLIITSKLFSPESNNVKNGNGYEQINWGQPTDIVEISYPGLNFSNEQEIGEGLDRVIIKEYNQPVNSEGIQERTFYFVNRKLYKVQVQYISNSSSDYPLMMTEKFFEEYGEPKEPVKFREGDFWVYCFDWKTKNTGVRLVIFEAENYYAAHAYYTDISMDKKIKNIENEMEKTQSDRTKNGIGF